MTRYFFILFFLGGCCLREPLAEERVFQIAYMSAPPFIEHHERGKPTGIFVDILERLFELSRFKAKYNFISPDAYYRMIYRGVRNDLLFTMKGSELDKQLIYSEQSVLTPKVRLYWLDEHTKVHNIEAIKGSSIILQAGYSYGGLAERIRQYTPQVAIYFAPNHIAASKMLRERRAKFLLNYERIFDYGITSCQCPNYQSILVKSSAVYVGVHKNVPDGESVLKQFDIVLHQMKQSGEIERIANSYLQTDKNKESLKLP